VIGQVIRGVVSMTFGRGASVLTPMIHSAFALDAVIEQKVFADAIGKFARCKQEFPRQVDAAQRKRGRHFACNVLDEGAHVGILQETLCRVKCILRTRYSWRAV
jgi:hypothetical protein